ncbi:hypothetical protein [Rhodococcus sp. OK302]|uniref:hypothetical protein n=1 Tax=Rhodococcus sp. OK302 TaxID=1882769 RepID=UPI000B93A2CA|nr:hypothetical protein [Rhodococcus sp. OK302]OYD69422.1 hypothetical protein BDB13_2989 [Rhodococcus sp. OK302]
MSRTSVRRAVATTASLTLIAAGVTVGMGAGIASAAPTCEQSSSVTKKDASTGELLGIGHTYTKSVTEAEVAAGTEVTYETVISTSGIGNPFVDRVTDFAPAGFGAPVQAEVTAFHAIGGLKTETVATTADGTGYKVANSGWSVTASNPLTVKMTYLVPAGVSVGDEITSGGISVAGTAAVGNNLPDLDACFTVRGKNAGESVSGSLDGMGLGSSDSNMSSTGSLSDFIGDVISRIFSNGS